MPQPLNESQLQALLRIKRHEQPPPGYFDNLLDRVHRRQREELLRRPAWKIALERIRTFLLPFHVNLRHAGAMAALLVVGIFAIRTAIPEHTTQPTGIAPANSSSNVADSKPGWTFQIEPGAAQPPIYVPENRLAQRDPNAPTRFIIDAQPVSYETTQIQF